MYFQTGALAADGKEMWDGFRLGLDQFSEKGQTVNVNGTEKKLKVYTADTKEQQPAATRTAIDLLLGNGAKTIMTGYASCPIDTQRMGPKDVPYLHQDTFSTGCELVAENPEEWWNVIQLDPTEQTYGPAIFETTTKTFPEETGWELPNKKAAVLTLEWGYCKLISESYKKIAKEQGWEIALDTVYPRGTTEFGAQIAKLQEINPSVIVVSGLDPASEVAFLKQFRENPTDSILYMQYAPSIPEFMKLAGESAEGILWSTCINYIPGKPETEKFLENFKERYGREPGSSSSAQAYDHAKIFIETVEAVGLDDYKEFCDYIYNNQFEGVCGTYDIVPPEEGAHGKSGADYIPVHMYQVQEQKHELVELSGEVREGQTYELPPWLE